MLVNVENVFSAQEAAAIRSQLEAASWLDGKVTAGLQSAQVKRNRQLPEGDPLAVSLGEAILQRLSRNNVFMLAALPRKIFPPLSMRAARPSACMSIKPCAPCLAAASGCEPICRRRFFSLRRRATMVASW